MDVETRQNIVEHGQTVEQPYFLEGACQPEPHALVRGKPDQIGAAKTHSARVGLIVAAHQVEQRRFSGAVRPNDGKHFALRDTKRNVADGVHSAKALV